ncbi:L-ascorbate metabolism protein UlaG, beta-lactamase superfamily [Geodermatophilus pulveris]|uniref:L-ascorbate metabolism protein UlaG, beta-lactamase superfamily n=1 Tax=Geodermatophilus pulveris TaxID=1564159 RepID=A0A239BUT3_9ACTN|nr:MBL fold metallo-hydrolase [Geodermatophilus pulveris]SNS11178.1 L-ascorbate metabolism protein UlaG, beta-lactamase superfamily [Geodermatophilus pulveris]
MTDAADEQVPVRVLGGPTVLIGYGGLRVLTDPTFDGPGEYPLGGGRVLTKTAPPAADPADLGALDVVLLSHDQHPDNLDASGRALLADVPVVLTTRSAAGRLGGGVRGLAPWESVQLERPGGGPVTVTATPARHGPEGCEPVTGEVVGFLLTADGLPTVHVSGDNASLDVVREIAGRVGPVDTAVLFAGAARTALFDGALLTVDGGGAAEAAALLGARRVVAAHCDSWAHFSEGRDDVVAAFTAAGLADRLQPA